MSITEVEDLTVFCRVCLQLPSESEQLDLNLIYDEEEQLTYYDCFTMCTQIHLGEDEGLPQNLCRGCGLELQMAYDFYKKVEESKRFLTQLQDQQSEAVEEAVEESTILEVVQEEETTTAVEEELVVQQEQEPELQTEEDEHAEQDEHTEEEHLEMEEYQVLEHMDDEDAETIQIKINKQGESEEYFMQAVTVNDEESQEPEQITWEDAVVTVANEQHLPVKAEINAIKTESNIDTDSNDVKFMYEDEEILDFAIEDEAAVAAANNDSSANDLCKIKPTRFVGSYNCDICQKVFPNHSRMKLHQRSHLTDRPKFPCEHCGREYATKQAKEVHIRTVHLKNGFVCPICSKLYVIKKSLEVHLRYHTGDFPYVCDLCGKKYAQIGHLNTHRNVKHNSVRFSCEYPNCGKFFTSSTSLRNHEFSHGEMPFQCSYCEKGYPSKSKLKVHIRRKHDLELTLDQLEPMRKFKTMRSKLNLVKVVEYVSYKTHLIIKEEDDADIEVNFEEEVLVDENDLINYKDLLRASKSGEPEQNTQKIHVQLKTEFMEKLSESENEIDEDFTFEVLYNKVFEDIKSEKLEEKKSQITSEKFIEKKRRRGRPRLDEHCENIDDPDYMTDDIEANEKKSQKRRRGAPVKNDQNGPPFCCEVCDTQFQTRAQLNSHRFRKHRPVDPDSPFSCSKCNRIFPTQQALERHLRRPTCDAYPQFDCEHCGKKCIGLSNYNIHLRFHKRQYPFVCHLCGKKFMMRVHLNEHVAVKHENKRYPCEHPGCGKLFQTRNSLYNHSYSHTGFMPYECEYCKRGYASKSRLRFHCKKSHNVDHSIDELDRMQVSEKLRNTHIKPQ